jgi:hypothetical protein
MATIYVDVEGGNDANDGLSFANRKKTLTSATAAAGGPHTIRVMKSPDPTSIGSATWTQGSATVTIPAGLVKTVEMGEATWSVGSNVTSTTTTTAKEGTNAMQLAIGASFATGLVAWKGIGTQNFTGYRQLSFWIRQSSGTVLAAGVYRLSLCDDAAGTIERYSFNIPALGLLNQWHAFTIDLGANMGSNVQSIALYCATDTGAVTLQLDNIIACKDPTAADSISLRSLISKNDGSGTEPWAPIRSINGTTVVLDERNTTLSSATNVSLYAGTTETVTTYKRDCVRPAAPTSFGSTAFGNVSGSAGGQSITGGWNTTDMSTQTGKTYIDYINCQAYGLNGCGGTTISDISLVRCSTALNFTANHPAMFITVDDIIGSGTGFSLGANATTPSTYNITNICYNNSALGVSSGTDGTAFSFVNVSSNSGVGSISGNGSSDYARNFVISIQSAVNNNSTLSLLQLYGATITLGTVKNTNGAVLSSPTTLLNFGNGNAPLVNCSITLTTVASNPILAAAIGYNLCNSTLTCTGATITGGTTAMQPSGQICYDSTIIGGTFTPNVKVSFGSLRFIGSSVGIINNFKVSSGETSVMNVGGDSTVNRLYLSASASAAGSNALADAYTSNRHTPSGYAWRVNGPASTTVSLPLGKIAVSGGSLVTAKVWALSQNIAAPLSAGALRASDRSGTVLAADVSVSTTVASQSGFEELTLTFTPLITGVVEFFADAIIAASGGATGPMVFDDFSVSQA